MKITDVKAIPVWEGGRNFLFVKVETDEGLYGIGESGLSWKELAVAGAVEHLKGFLLGEDPRRIEHLWQTMFRGGFFPGGRILCAAISAIDIALWDLRGKALGVPVYDLLGGRVRDKVVCYPHNGGGTPEQLAENCRASVEAGWKFVRWGLPTTDGDMLEPAQAVRRAIAEFEAVRAAVGPNIGLCFDVHTRLDPPDTIRLCREVERFHPFFMEDPLRAEGTFTYRQLARHVATPLAAGEQLASKWEFRELIEEELIQYARLDLCIVGGISEARKIAGWCETHYIHLAPHNPLGPVSTAACLHLDLAVPNFGVQELPRPTGTSLNEVFPVQVEWAEGYLLPPERPGLGVEFDEEAAKAYPFREVKPPLLRRADGSLTNW